jgi:hypothetical protein
MNLTVHARRRIAERPFTDEGEVMKVMLNKGPAIRRHWEQHEVRVIIKTLKAVIELPDGSNGDVVVACVDPASVTVKTVMLERAEQIQARSKYRVYV